MLRRHLIAVFLVFIVAANAAAVAHAATPPPVGAGLGGEVFDGIEVSTSNKSCDPNGTSSFDFATQGVATGVYPGTYTESGTITVGPQDQVGEPLGIRRGFSAGTVLAFDATFTIDSPLAQVSGHKTITAVVPENVAACAIVDTHDFGVLYEVCSDVDYQDVFLPLIDYDATIVTPTAMYSDSGAAIARFEQFTAFCPALGPGGFIGPGGVFQEVFVASAPTETAGEATGGGMIAGVAGAPGIAFGFNARSTGLTFNGNCTVLDQALSTQVKCLDVTSYVQTGNQATFRGNAEVNGTPTTYRIVVTDNGEPGVGDMFAITTDSGYSAGGALSGGDVQVR